MSLSECCLKGFRWDGTPVGRVDTLAGLPTYITGESKDASSAILFLADALGWKFPNARLMADHLAQEIGTVVYVPDLFEGEELNHQLALEGRFAEAGIPAFLQRNSRAIREPDVMACARALREEHRFEKVGAIGFCYGGWAALRLGAVSWDGDLEGKKKMVDVVSIGHPSLVTKQDLDEIRVPLQVLAPEHDASYSPELKAHTLATVPKLGVPFDYQHFPGVQHGALMRGWEQVEGERAAMRRAKMAAVTWFQTFL